MQNLTIRKKIPSKMNILIPTLHPDWFRPGSTQATTPTSMSVLFPDGILVIS